MKKRSCSIIFLSIVGMMICFSATVRADDEKAPERITDMVGIYGKKTVLFHIIGGDNNNFTIRVENILMKSPNPLRGINEAYLDIATIRHDMKRFRVTIDELEKRLKQYDEEQAASEQRKTQEHLKKQEIARQRELERRKRLMEEATLESAFEEAIGKPIEEEATSPEGEAEEDAAEETEAEAE